MKLTALALVGAALFLTTSAAHAQVSFGRDPVACVDNSPGVTHAAIQNCEIQGTGGKCSIVRRVWGAMQWHVVNWNFTPIAEMPPGKRHELSFSYRFRGTNIRCTVRLAMLRTAQDCRISSDGKRGECNVLMQEVSGPQWFNITVTLDEIQGPN